MVEANPCSIGYTGSGGEDAELTATSGTLTNYASSVNAVPRVQECIESGAYPLSQLLYDNTLLGFRTSPGGVADPELALAKCLSGNNIAGGTLSSMITSAGLVPFAGGPYCQDFHNADCGDPAEDATHPSACANNPVGIAP